jgi:hypothetical protein
LLLQEWILKKKYLKFFKLVSILDNQIIIYFHLWISYMLRIWTFCFAKSWSGFSTHTLRDGKNWSYLGKIAQFI